MSMWKWCLLLAVLIGIWCVTATGGESEKKARFAADWRVRAEYPQFENKAIDVEIQGWLEERISTEMSNVSVVMIEPEHVGGAWNLDVGYEIIRPSPHVMSLVFTLMIDTAGAAHPATSAAVLLFDVQTGKQLHLADIFADPEMALSIMAENAPRLVEEAGMKNNREAYPDGLDRKAWFMDGFEPFPVNYSALVLEPEGVRVIFQQYQVLPYVFGMPEAHFPLSLLEPAGPNHALWRE